MRKSFYFFFTLLLLWATLITPAAQAATSITYYGITWTFSEDRPTGQFANGEPYVVGPVTISNITPNPSQTNYGDAQHGSMINPMPGTPQGFDSNAGKNSLAYDPTKNITLKAPYEEYARDANGAIIKDQYNNPVTKPVYNLNFPFTLQIGDVLVSAKSQAYYPTWIKTYAALTVLGSVPPAGSFRPSLYGNDRSVKYNVTQINWSLLKNFTAPSATPLKASIEAEIPALPWFEYSEMWNGNSLQGDLNTSDGPVVDCSSPTGCHYRVYGRETSAKFGRIALWLNTDQPLSDKKAIAIQMIQNGIDIHDYVAHYDGQGFRPDGGHKSGRKLPLVFAAMMLGATDLKTMAANPNVFSEDLQTFIVCGPEGGAHCKSCSPTDSYIWANWSQGYPNETIGSRCVNGKINDVGRDLWTALPGDSWYGRVTSTYTNSDVGMPDWGIRHSYYPFEDNAAWSATYRSTVYDGMIGNWLAASLMGAEAIWNHPAGFRYAKERVGFQGFGSFISDMAANLQGGAVIVQPPVVTPPAVTTPAAVSAVYLVTNPTGARISALTSGMTIDLSTLSSTDLNVEATTSTTTGISRVDFQLDTDAVRSESYAPYALCGDWTTCLTNTLKTAGSHTLVVKPYNSSGVLGVVSTITFNVVSQATPLAVVAAVTINPNGGSFSSAQNVSMSSATSGAEIRYTVDGTAPIATSLLYTNPILVGSTQTLKAIALKSGMSTSAVNSASFTITLPPPVTPPVGTVAAVSISPADGTYYSRQTITMTSATTGAEIRYTLDGTTPTASSIRYTAAFTLSSSKTIKAIAIKSGMNNSAVSTRTLTIKKSPPKGIRIVY